MGITKTLTLVVAVSLLSGLLESQSLSSPEIQLVQHIDSHQKEAIKFLRQVVNINSGTMNHKGVRQVGSFFQKTDGHSAVL